jgi:hypothetical protein
VAANTNALIDQAKCIDQCIPKGMQLSVLISIFARLAGVPPDTQSLINAALCIDQCIPPGMQLAVLNGLANTLTTAGAGGCLTCGAGDPTNTPAGGCCLYIQTDSIPPGTIWQYYSGSWH